LVSAGDTQIESIATLELNRPFDLVFLRDGNWSLQYYIETLTELLNKIGQHGESVNVVLNYSMVMMKKVPLAMGLEKELVEEQLQWEAEQMLVSDPNLYSLVHDRLPFSTPNGNPMYLQVLVRKKVVETIKRLVSEAGLNVSDLDVDCFSMIRTLSSNNTLDPQDLVVVLDLHRDSIGLVFIRKQEYFLSTRIGIPEPYDEASELVRVVLKDLRRIVFGHGLGKGIEDIQRFFVLDHIAQRGFISALSAAAGIEVQGIHPFQKVTVSSEVSRSAEYEAFPERFTTAVGAILKRNPSLVG